MTRQPASCAAYNHERLSSVWSSLSADVLRYLNKSPENTAAGDNLKSRLGALLTPQMMCLILYRTAHYLFVKDWRRVATLLARVNFLLHKVNIPPQSCIGAGCFLPHPAGVTFCGTAGRGLTFYSLGVCCPQAEFFDAPLEHAPRLGDRVTVGAHAVLIGAISVGDDAKIAFSLHVASDVPAGAMVVSKALRVRLRQRPETDDNAKAALSDSSETAAMERVSVSAQP